MFCSYSDKSIVWPLSMPLMSRGSVIGESEDAASVDGADVNVDVNVTTTAVARRGAAHEDCRLINPPLTKCRHLPGRLILPAFVAELANTNGWIDGWTLVGRTHLQM